MACDRSRCLFYDACGNRHVFLLPLLRIELLAEPLFAASIVSTGALRGAGDTLIPGILNLISMWGVRISLALILVGRLGLPGVWTAMCIELNVRGILFLIRLARGRWLDAAFARRNVANA